MEKSLMGFDPEIIPVKGGKHITAKIGDPNGFERRFIPVEKASSFVLESIKRGGNVIFDVEGQRTVGTRSVPIFNAGTPNF